MEAPVTTTMEDTAAPASKAGKERIVTKVSSTKKKGLNKSKDGTVMRGEIGSM